MFLDKFEKAFAYAVSNEGEYVCNKHDQGGETKFGISQKAYPYLNIKDLTIDGAKKIYYNDYWIRAKCDQIVDAAVATKLFDLAVNTGIKQAAIILQRALRATGFILEEDGIIGSKTIQCANEANPSTLLAAMKSESAGYYRLIVAKRPSQRQFLLGWLNRAYKKLVST